MACCAGRRASPATPAARKTDTEEHHCCQDGDLGLKEGEGEEGKWGSTTGSRMSAAPRRPRPGDSRPEQNNDLALSEKDQQQGLNGVGGDSRERSGSRRGRRRVASLRGGEKGRARQNQGQVGATAHCKPFLFFIHTFYKIMICTVADKIILFSFYVRASKSWLLLWLHHFCPTQFQFLRLFREHQNLIQVKCYRKVKTC